MYNNYEVIGLDIYYSNTFRGGFDEICKALKRNSQDLSKNNIIIVPDRFSLTIEKAVLDKLKLNGSMNIEVVSFSRLAAGILGNRIKKCLSPDSAVMLLSRVIRRHNKELSCYNKVKDIAAFSSDMYAAISELRNSGITVEMLKERRENIKNNGIRRKTEDIILLYEKYLAELSEDYNDSTTRLNKLAEEIPHSQKIADSHIYITDFYHFKEIEYQIIRELIQHAISVSVALLIKPENSYNSRIYPYYKVKSIADELGIEVKEYYHFSKLDSINSIIEGRLFSYDINNKFESGDRLKLYQARTIESELINVARDIRRLIREDGLRYRDVAIVCSDIDGYTPYLESIMKRFDIPYFIDRKEMLKNHPLIRLIISIFDYDSSGSINYAIEVVKNIFSGIDYADTEIFENYCIEYGIKGGQLAYEFVNKGKREEILLICKRVRERFIDLYKYLCCDDILSVSQYIERIRSFLKYIDADSIMSNLAKAQKHSGDTSLAEVTKQVPNKLKTILCEIEEMLSEEILDRNEFVNVLLTAFGNVSISMIPQFVDSVFIGEPIESRYAVIKAMYVVGADENSILKKRKDNGIISSHETAEWGLTISPDIKVASSLDKLHIQQLLIKPERLLCISYCSYSVKGEIINPSPLMRQFERMFNVSIQSANTPYKDSLLMDNEQDRAKIYASQFSTPRNALYELCNVLRLMKAGGIINSDIKPYNALYSAVGERIRKEIEDINNMFSHISPYIRYGDKLFFKNTHSTSVSQLESYYNCPFRHFMQYGINPIIRKESVIEADKWGIIIHKAIEVLIAHLIKSDNNFSVAENEKMVLIKRCLDIALEDSESDIKINSSGYLQIYDFILRATEIVLDSISRSKFKPFMVEASFGMGRDFKPIEINYDKTKSINLKGKIDRIDKYGDNVIVIDYKTGSVSNDIDKDLRYGLKLQLFVYLNALSAENLIPVGLLYLSLNDKYKRKEESKFSYSGLIIKEMINEFDLSHDAQNALIDNKSEIEKEKMDDYLKLCIELVKNACREIDSGYIEAKPIKDSNWSSCNYCDYYDICRAGLNEPMARNKKKIGKSSEEA